MAELLDKNLGIASNNLELEELKNKYNYYHPYYIALATMTNRDEIRNWIESLWDLYQPYADSNFVSEFKRQFNQRCWELYLGSTLLNRRYTLAKHSNLGPDFKIINNLQNIWIEAIAVEKGEGRDRVPEIEYGKAIDVPEIKMVLRLTSAVNEKYNKYLSYVKNGIISSNEPYIIAIDRSPLDHLDAQIPLILKCLFAIGYQVLTIKKSAPRPKITESNWSSRDKVLKINGSEVNSFIFGNKRFEGISAIIYCQTNIYNNPRESKYMGKNFVSIYNPFAKNPLPDDFFSFGEVWKQQNDQVIKIHSSK